jgi:hypothetical protein
MKLSKTEQLAREIFRAYNGYSKAQAVDEWYWEFKDDWLRLARWVLKRERRGK